MGRVLLDSGLDGAVSGAQPGTFWLGVAVAAGVSAFLLRMGAQAFWRLRTISDTATSRVHSASQGYLELAGLARAIREETRGPLTGLPCLWYRYLVEERRGSGKNEHWVKIDGGDYPEPFSLDDGTARCIVEPSGAFLRLRRSDRWRGSHRNPDGRSSGTWLSTGRYRFTEERIQDGDPLYILGSLETPSRGSAEREQLKRALLKVWKQDPARMARFDRNGDGQIDLDEWEQARTEAETLAAKSELRQSALPVDPRIRDTGDSRQPFVISTYTEEELASGLRWQALGATLGGAALGVGAAVIALARL